MVLMRGHNICLPLEIKKLSLNYSQFPLLSAPLYLLEHAVPYVCPY